ncbi:MAG TPA: phosphate signaling complex protein PhoU [Gammaproteobacteria bacterium]|nr:phosphate signaling complex protein PhoU [Xanthomonadales bacterium]MCB1593979.1 phosphate signaling complex protein PhoU [Xanthomonadales bacterium]HOP22577.1 phosphate signaling complex protein PhoU [Gammaproteobacteria bacterium]HPI95620.1 phosphate signaling complex protein PhoU [Gammaproteobacteria bacterium]HPQ86797.1 phosphate signaling complex protein PhoU [Gammaproteobacteria bacterium]
MDTIGFNQHTSHEYNEELEEIRNLLLNMGGMVEKQLQKSVQSILQTNTKMAKKVIKKDLGVNALEVKIDEECTRIIAKRQPAASDLRLIIAVIKCSTDLERIGDEAEKIAKCGHFLIENNFQGQFYKEFEKLSQVAIQNLHHALNSLARLDFEAALATVKKDDFVDQLFESLNNDIILSMSEVPNQIQSLLRLSWASKALEKVGDHTKNICEYIIYLVKGKDVRHLDIDTLKEEYF